MYQKNDLIIQRKPQIRRTMLLQNNLKETYGSHAHVIVPGIPVYFLNLT